MSDFLSGRERSELMSRVRSRGTLSELFVRKMIWKAGFRYRLNYRKLPGTPDIVLPRYQITVFVQGCFWHGHSCKKGQRRPSSNQDFWNEKLDKNMERDSAAHARLREMGWTVVEIWECQLHEGTDTLLRQLQRLRASSA